MDVLWFDHLPHYVRLLCTQSLGTAAKLDDGESRDAFYALGKWAGFHRADRLAFFGGP